MDDEFFGRGFGIGRRGFGDFGGGGESFFFNDFNRVFKEMDDMMRNFGLGHFSMIEGRSNYVLVIFQNYFNITRKKNKLFFFYFIFGFYRLLHKDMTRVKFYNL